MSMVQKTHLSILAPMFRRCDPDQLKSTVRGQRRMCTKRDHTVQCMHLIPDGIKNRAEKKAQRCTARVIRNDHQNPHILDGNLRKRLRADVEYVLIREVVGHCTFPYEHMPASLP